MNSYLLEVEPRLGLAVARLLACFRDAAYVGTLLVVLVLSLVLVFSIG